MALGGLAGLFLAVVPVGGISTAKEYSAVERTSFRQPILKGKPGTPNRPVNVRVAYVAEHERRFRAGMQPLNLELGATNQSDWGFGIVSGVRRDGVSTGPLAARDWGRVIWQFGQRFCGYRADQAHSAAAVSYLANDFDNMLGVGGVVSLEAIKAFGPQFADDKKWTLNTNDPIDVLMRGFGRISSGADSGYLGSNPSPPTSLRGIR